MGLGNQAKVVDIMTANPIVMTPAETIGKADELMTEHRIRQVPVVDDGALLGIITDRDLRSFLAQSSLVDPEQRAKALKTKVSDVMTAKPLTLAPDDKLQEAVEMLIDERIGSVPVVDETEGLVGIVTYVDLLRCFLQRLQEE